MPENIVLMSLTRSELTEIVTDAVHSVLKTMPPHVIQVPEEEKVLSRKEDAKLLKISLGTLNVRMHEGEVPFTRSGRRVLFFKSEILKMLAEKASRT